MIPQRETKKNDGHQRVPPKIVARSNEVMVVGCLGIALLMPWWCCFYSGASGQKRWARGMWTVSEVDNGWTVGCLDCAHKGPQQSTGLMD